MMIQVYLTILAIFVLIAGGIGAVFGRPFLKRWQDETREEKRQKQKAQQETLHREAARREVEQWCSGQPDPETETASRTPSSEKRTS